MSDSQSDPTSDDPIDDVAPGDIIVVDRGDGDRPYKVVHKASSDAGYLVTFEDDDAETFQLDLATGTETVLSEKRSVDDQIEWLDDQTLLYGLADETTEGDSNIWKLPTDPASQPSLFIEHAWSPSVVR